ncbi:hypothetical protein BH18ACT12_BH18ACT12_01410 [soil metagenome]
MAASRKKSESREAGLRKRAALRGYTLRKERDGWHAELGGTHFGPMYDLNQVDEFLPKGS